MVDILRVLVKDHAVLDDDVMTMVFFTYDMMWMILCYSMEISHILSWFMEGYDKALSAKETKQVDLDEIKRMSWYLYAAYFVTGWWYLHCHILGIDDGHI